MNSYRFILKDYRAIGNADIKIDGITVIAGINGCGKSTISRWLYSYINTSQSFDRLVIADLVERCNLSLQRLGRIIRGALRDSGEAFSFRSIPSLKFNPDSEAVEIQIEKILSDYRHRIFSGCELLRKTIDRNPEIRKWTIKSLGEKEGDISSEDFILNYYEKESEWAFLRLDSTLNKINQRKLSDLFTFIHDNGLIHGAPPQYIQFVENGIDLIDDGRFKPPVGLERAIYIDTPMFLSDMVVGNIIWEKLKSDLITPLKDVPFAAKKLSLRIRKIIGGYIESQEAEFTNELELRYIRSDDNLNIPLEEAATGLKSFAYLMRLIDYGYLNEDSLLIIDEPEAHLHPQWIVEFARILVLINKELGTRLLLASHNPDLVAAISEISKAQGLEKTTNFYQAIKTENSLKYDYEYFGQNVEGIFRSFNGAFDKIREYGE